MKIIEKTQLKDFEHHEAIFFTPEGIIVDTFLQSPVIHFLNATKNLNLDINAIYLDSDILIVDCQSSSNLNLSHQLSICPARTLLTMIDEQMQEKILRTLHWLNWNNKSRYCSQCGHVLDKLPQQVEKKCQACAASFFPNAAPAIMVLIQKNDEILLARSSHFSAGMYSAIAGFIDLGESAEAAVHREVKEEVGIEISQLAYFGSQTWPFPYSFMIAFKAQYLSGMLKIDSHEIEDAQWFNVNNLPLLPFYPSISRRLIDSWIAEYLV